MFLERFSTMASEVETFYSVHRCALMLNKLCSESFHEHSKNEFVYYCVPGK